MEEIRLTEILMKENLIEYFRTKDIEYLEYLQNNIQELQRLREKTKEYYSKAFNQILSNHPQDMNINKIKINKIKIKMFREVKKYPRTNKNRSIPCYNRSILPYKLSAPPTMGIRAYAV